MISRNMEKNNNILMKSLYSQNVIIVSVIYWVCSGKDIN